VQVGTETSLSKGDLPYSSVTISLPPRKERDPDGPHKSLHLTSPLLPPSDMKTLLVTFDDADSVVFSLAVVLLEG